MDGVKQVKNKCKLREHVFHAGAARIRLHSLQVPGCGVAKCKAAEDKLEPDKKVMQQLEQEGGAARSTQLTARQNNGFSSSSNSSSSSKEAEDTCRSCLSRPPQQP
eukprot:1142409-Pelagomonas_calceolata.AAC.8